MLRVGASDIAATSQRSSRRRFVKLELIVAISAQELTQARECRGLFDGRQDWSIAAGEQLIEHSEVLPGDENVYLALPART